MSDFTTISWTLQNIIAEVRGITGRPDVSMMTDQAVVNYINYYYQYVLMKELKIFWGYTYFNFYCEAGVDKYTAPSNFQTLNPQVWADGWPLEWYLSPDLFYQDYPEQLNKAVVATGDGINPTFPFTCPAFPIIPGSLYVTDGTQTATDNGIGSFVSPATGTIDYLTGAVSVTFAVAPLVNTNITVSSATYMANRPQGILYFPQNALANSTPAALALENFFVLRPVPDQVYQIKLQGIQLPNPLINYTDVAFRPDLGPLIALGASLHIFKLFNQMDQYDQALPEYNRFKDICMQDTFEEYLYQRSVPAF